MKNTSREKISELLDNQKFGSFSSLMPKNLKTSHSVEKKNIVTQKTSKINLSINTIIKNNSTNNNYVNLLVGKEFILVEYLFNLCVKKKSMETPPIFSKDLMSYLSIKSNHLRNIINRLCKKQIFTVRTSNGGYSSRVFVFEKDAYDFLFEREEDKKSFTKNKRKAPGFIRGDISFP